MSIEAIKAATAEVRDLLTDAHHDVVAARQGLDDALRTLADLSRNHTTSLIPPELQRADGQVAECLELIAGSLTYIDRFVAGL